MSRIQVLFAGLTLWLVTGCAESNKEPAPTAEQCADERREEFELTYRHMTENALLSDMSISDCHFLPDRARLTSLGEVRLSKLAALVRDYGGTIRFNSNETDKTLLDKRTETLREYLAQAGLATTPELLKADMPGGAGMAATSVVLIKVNEGQYRPKKSSGAATGGQQPAAAGGAGGAGGSAYP